MAWFSQTIHRSKIFRRIWWSLIGVVVAFAGYSLYRWLWLGEALPQHFFVAKALFIALLVLLLGINLVWKSWKHDKSND